MFGKTKSNSKNSHQKSKVRFTEPIDIVGFTETQMSCYEQQSLELLCYGYIRRFININPADIAGILLKCLKIPKISFEITGKQDSHNQRSILFKQNLSKLDFKNSKCYTCRVTMIENDCKDPFTGYGDYSFQLGLFSFENVKNEDIFETRLSELVQSLQDRYCDVATTLRDECKSILCDKEQLFTRCNLCAYILVKRNGMGYRVNMNTSLGTMNPLSISYYRGEKFDQDYCFGEESQDENGYGYVDIQLKLGDNKKSIDATLKKGKFLSRDWMMAIKDCNYLMMSSITCDCEKIQPSDTDSDNSNKCRGRVFDIEWIAS